MRDFAAIIFVLLVLLAGCASIPFSTAVRLASIKPQELAQVDPSQVRVRVSIPEGFELNVPASRLTLALGTPSGERKNVKMGLSLLQHTREHRSTGLFSGNLAVSTYVLALTPEGAQQLRSMQQFVLASNPDTFQFGVSVPLAKTLPNAREMTFWAEVRLSAKDRYTPLIDAAKIKFQDSAAGS
jgi:hypothetical protein